MSEKGPSERGPSGQLAEKEIEKDKKDKKIREAPTSDVKDANEMRTKMNQVGVKGTKLAEKEIEKDKKIKR